MKIRICKIFSSDSILIFVFMSLMWTMLTVARCNLKHLTDDASVVMFMNVLWTVIMCFGTMALMAVFIHLKNHKERIYTEDIENGEKYK